MGQCKNCFTNVDGREAKHCSDCNSELHKDCAIKDNGAFFCDVCYTAKEEAPQNKFGDYELPDYIRRTYIETYRSCPYKFYLEVIKGNKMPPNEYTQVGSDVHEVIEKLIRNEIPTNQAYKMIGDQFDEYSDSLFVNKSKEDMRKRADDSLDTFIQNIYEEIENVHSVEENIRFEVGDNVPDVSITMDLITEKDGKLEMHDWKTGKVMVGQKLSSDLQAPLYIRAVKKHFDQDVRKFTFYYLQENKTREFIQSEIDPQTYICTVGKREYKVNITDAVREVKTIFSRMQKGDFNIPQDTRKMHFTCKMCHLREEGLCEGADVQSWINLNNKGVVK